jgi:hypothetical protein
MSSKMAFRPIPAARTRADATRVTARSPLLSIPQSRDRGRSNSVSATPCAWRLPAKGPAREASSAGPLPYPYNLQCTTGRNRSCTASRSLDLRLQVVAIPLQGCRVLLVPCAAQISAHIDAAPDLPIGTPGRGIDGREERPTKATSIDLGPVHQLAYGGVRLAPSPFAQFPVGKKYCQLHLGV